MNVAPSSPSADPLRRAALPGARLSLILLLSINLFNYIDRYVLGAVLPRIEADFFPPGSDEKDKKAKLGSLTTAFLVTYMVASPVFGWLASRMRRWLLVGVGVIFWSLASGGSGLADTFLILFLTRCLIGVGEAAYGPVAPTMISDLYPVASRGKVLAVFYMAIPVGSALGYVLGGTVADTSLGWRWAFYLVVAPGLLLGLLCFFMREPRVGQADPISSPPSEGGAGGGKRTPKLKDYAILFRTPSYVLNTIGMTAMTFVVGGVSVWMPTYIYDREARYEWTAAAFEEVESKGIKISPELRSRLRELEGQVFNNIGGLQEQLIDTDVRTERAIFAAARTPKLGLVNTYFGGIIVVSGFTATLLGGMVGDALRARWSGSYFLVSGIGMIVGFPLFLWALVAPLPLGWFVIFAAVFCMFFNTGPSNAILANVTHPALRAPAFALNIFIIHALGDAISPPIIGAIADKYDHDLGPGFFAVSGVILVSGVAWICGSRYLAHDTAAAPQSLDKKEK